MVLSKRPVEEAIIPLPIPEITPPETRTYFLTIVELREVIGKAEV
jgi:hypothetical protein